MAFRRRRRRAGMWLPVLGHNLVEDPAELFECSFERNLTVGPLATDITTEEVGVTFDFPGNAFAGSTPSLADFTQSGYSLRRIVGKVSLSHSTFGFNETPALARPNAVRVVCYWIIRRVDELGNSLAGANELAGNLRENIQDPYIWRSTWNLGLGFLGSAPSTQGPAEAVANFPGNNCFDGGQKNGPFFDAKTRRTVKDEERLFFGVTTKAMPLDVDYGIASELYCHVDFRIFAFPLSTSGNRRNASR